MNVKLIACWALTLALAAAGGAFWERSHQPEGSPAAPVAAAVEGKPEASSQTPSAEIQALRQEIARLKAGQAPSGGTAPVPATTAVKPQDVERLLAQARDGLKAKDFRAFSEPFLALLDAGEPAYAGLMALIPDLVSMQEDPAFMQDPANMEAVQEFYAAFLPRAPKLGGLMDALLSKPGEPDGATDFALQLWQMGAKSALPRETQVHTLLALLKKGEGAGDGRESMASYLAATLLLGKLKAAEVLPEVEKLALESGQRMAWAIPQALAQMGGPEALASLKRILDKSQDEQARMMILSSLMQMKDAGPLLWELAEKSEDPQERSMALQGLAAKPENLDRILAKLRESGLNEQDRQSILRGVVAASRQNPAAKEAVWRLYDADPALQPALLQQMAFQGDVRARGIISEQMRAGRLSEELSLSLGSLASMDHKWARENAESFRSLVASSPSQNIRATAFQALCQVDRPGAVQSLLQVFHRLPEEERMGTVAQLLQGGREGREALQGIAAQDPSPTVRAAAAAALKGGNGMMGEPPETGLP